MAILYECAIAHFMLCASRVVVQDSPDLAPMDGYCQYAFANTLSFYFPSAVVIVDVVLGVEIRV